MRILRRAASSSCCAAPSTPVLSLEAKALSWQAFVEYYFGQRPVILKNASDLSSWSFDSWRGSLRRRGEEAAQPGDLFIRGGSNTLSQRGNAELLTDVTPAAIMSLIFPCGSHDDDDDDDGRAAAEDGPPAFFFQWRTRLPTLSLDEQGVAPPVDPTGSTLPPCVPLPQLLRSWPGVTVRPDGESAVFVTSAGARTAMHSDSFDNVLLHLHGRKRVTLVDPSVARAHSALVEALFTTPGTHEDLYEHRRGAGDERSSSSSSSDRGALAMPRLHCVLEPGQLLYIPFDWFHDVESTSATVSAALRFDVGSRVSPDVIHDLSYT